MRDFPSSDEEGWRDSRRLTRRGGVDQEIDFVEQHHPPPSIDASPFLEAARYRACASRRARALAAAALLN